MGDIFCIHSYENIEGLGRDIVFLLFIYFIDLFIFQGLVGANGMAGENGPSGPKVSQILQENRQIIFRSLHNQRRQQTTEKTDTLKKT